MSQVCFSALRLDDFSLNQSTRVHSMHPETAVEITKRIKLYVPVLVDSNRQKRVRCRWNEVNHQSGLASALSS